MNAEIPEEIRVMAALIGQSSEIDSMMVNQPKELVTNTNTLKQGLNQYIQQQRTQQAQQYVAPPPAQYPQVGMAPIVPIPNYIPPQSLPEVPQYGDNMGPKIDNSQLEFNLEPNKVDEIINLLKDISLKLTKQNKLLQSIHDIKPTKERISDTTIKLR